MNLSSAQATAINTCHALTCWISKRCIHCSSNTKKANAPAKFLCFDAESSKKPTHFKGEAPVSTAVREELREYQSARPVSIREAQKELTRARLIETSIVVFAQRGYAAATIDEIAKCANVGRTTVYKHFHGKSDIAEAIGERYGRELLSAVSAIRYAHPGDKSDVESWLTQFESILGRQSTWFHSGPLMPESIEDSLHRLDEVADEVLHDWSERGWETAVAAPAQSLRLLFNLVGRWVSYHFVYGVPQPENSRDALIELVNCEIVRIVRRAH
jgi:AcrR family transcriptional regulator